MPSFKQNMCEAYKVKTTHSLPQIRHVTCVELATLLLRRAPLCGQSELRYSVTVLRAVLWPVGSLVLSDSGDRREHAPPVADRRDILPAQTCPARGRPKGQDLANSCKYAPSGGHACAL